MRFLLCAVLFVVSGLASAAPYSCPPALNESQLGCTFTSTGGTTTYTVAVSAQAINPHATFPPAAPNPAQVAIVLTADNLPCGDGTFFTTFTTLAGNANGSCSFDVTPQHPVQFIAVSYTLNATPSYINMSANSTAFVPDYPLAVYTSGLGSGSVTSADGRIACGFDCAETYAPGANVTLTATPAIGSMFVGWSGDCFILTPTCTLTMNAAKNVTAIFAPADPSLVVEFYNANNDRYFITSDPDEAATVDAGGAGPGWARTGYTFKAGSGPVPVCRFYGSQSPGPNSHFYTAIADECNFLKQLQATTPSSQPRWNYEGMAFSTALPDKGACPIGTVPVYRAYNNGLVLQKDSNHRISASAQAIQEVLNRGWLFEGVVMCAFR